ncbi:hypothetical protein SCLCIDRAFT_25865 [Scleroderma citrinum Foug A]|uniref:Uncharacterized protein n=1 Tax=Scleroderma citrinum Foug A TaxID=1036808 RepID=A0A0C3DL10_9AGAM|nr:hypothetical protein SCLCIDRAFT_25865 [Scleroderma citrinum Foug A]
MEDNDPEGDERVVAGDGNMIDPKDDAGEEDVDEDSNEIVPIHHQVFHRYQPLKAGHIETYQEIVKDDTVLVHQQHFPVSLAEIAVQMETCVSGEPSLLEHCKVTSRGLQVSSMI